MSNLPVDSPYMAPDGRRSYREPKRPTSITPPEPIDWEGAVGWAKRERLALSGDAAGDLAAINDRRAFHGLPRFRVKGIAA